MYSLLTQLVYATLFGCLTTTVYPMHNNRDWARSSDINAPHELWNCKRCQLLHHPEIPCELVVARPPSSKIVDVVINEMTSERQRERERVIRDSDRRN
ncbi:hypothetical protein PGT21_017626 [Puccinia graminis f. sp. tritici]|uniref:Secreted protein n=1 Tax=Puccinia graminis f. sp. tritici TaxID=56615 RepID=A0A5B0NGJ3_PUCGR|nr:hypothetical protein PGT21_017626 [Puccinia graminis f. sp. tritici]KAA1129403.1 hypothetical protein PGTUg99_032354 [Puccinia graminis f. sp. tritici]